MSEMSFNFSDDDNEDDDIDLDAFDDTGLLALASRSRAEENSAAAAAGCESSSPFTAATTAASGKGVETNNNEGFDYGDDDTDDGGDWDNIDWEDADQDGDTSDDDEATEQGDALSKLPTEGVMINFGRAIGKSNDPDAYHDTQEKGAENKDGDKNEKEIEPSSSSKKRKRTTRVLRNVPEDTRQLILHVRRSHLLGSVVHCMHCSFVCGGRMIANVREWEHDDEDQSLLSHVALSVIPLEFHPETFINEGRLKSNEKEASSSIHSTSIPTRHQLHQFSLWFFQFVNKAGERRRTSLRRNVAQGARAVATPRQRRSRRRRDANMIQSATEQEQTNYSNRQFHTQSTIHNGHSYIVPSTAADQHLQILSYLSPYYDEDPQLFVEEHQNGPDDAISAVEKIPSRQKALLFLIMVRSLGWRARLVTSLSPMPLELTVDHPLLIHQKRADMIQKLVRAMHRNERRKRKRRKGIDTKSNTNAEMKDAIDLVSSGDEADETNGKKVGSNPLQSTTPQSDPVPDVANNDPLVWVEVLCRDSADNNQKQSMSPSTKPMARWVSIHPEQESFDKPNEAESILAWMEMNSTKNNVNTGSGMSGKKRKGKWSNKPPRSTMLRYANEYVRKSPVSYVLAVEHLPLPSSDNSPPSSIVNGSTNNRLRGARFTDVTPRYANVWSRTLRLRGATGKEITAGGGKCVDEWWAASLKRMNRHCRPPNRQKHPLKSPTKPVVRTVTKTKTKTGKDVDVVELESSDDDEKNGSTAYGSGSDDDHETIEAKEPTVGNVTEKIPTSKKGFKESPFYVIPSVLNSRDVLHPNAKKRICGVFKGELVYRRGDVSKAIRANKWLYQGRKVMEKEMEHPVKRIKARKKPAPKGFQSLSTYGVSEKAQEEMISSMDKKRSGEEDGMDSLYGIWQTEPWSPSYVGPNDEIPTNEYKNVELALINPGLTHMDEPRLSAVAKKLGIPYAPCMLGYEGHGGNRAPTIRGIVVHDHNVALLREAHVEWASHAMEKEREERRKAILKRWKRLVKGIMIKDRLDREYG